MIGGFKDVKMNGNGWENPGFTLIELPSARPLSVLGIYFKYEDAIETGIAVVPPAFMRVLRVNPLNAKQPISRTSWRCSRGSDVIGWSSGNLAKPPPGNKIAGNHIESE